MPKKQNALGQLSFLPPCWEFENIMEWLKEGNEHLMTDDDWKRLESLANRCFDGQPHSAIEALNMLKKYQK